MVSVRTNGNAVLRLNRQGFQTNPQPFSQVSTSVIEGFFPKEDLRKDMAIRKINTTLTIFLIVSLLITGISYYFATANEIVLNDLNRQTVVLNDENLDLQNKLDRLRSFKNVDMSMQQTNTLKKAQQVMEVSAVSSSVIADKKLNADKPFVWSIGY